MKEFGWHFESAHGTVRKKQLNSGLMKSYTPPEIILPFFCDLKRPTYLLRLICR